MRGAASGEEAVEGKRKEIFLKARAAAKAG
jgi:hypothetical protein